MKNFTPICNKGFVMAINPYGNVGVFGYILDNKKKVKTKK